MGIPPPAPSSKCNSYMGLFDGRSLVDDVAFDFPDLKIICVLIWVVSTRAFL